MNKPVGAAPNSSQRPPLAIILPLLIVIGAAISLIVCLLAGKDNPLPRLSGKNSARVLASRAATPSFTPLPTSTPQRIETPTLAPTATAAATRTPASTPSPTATSTPAPTHTPAVTPTATPTETPTLPAPTPTLHAIVTGDEVQLREGPRHKYNVLGSARQGDALPLVGRTGDSGWFQVSLDGQLAWIQAGQVEAAGATDLVPVVRPKDFPPTPTSTPTRPPRTPRPARTPPVPRPVLLEPSGGARFSDKVRFKFSWVRRLQEGERVSLYLWTGDGTNFFDWWVTEADILTGGGAVREEAGGVVYEINSGFGPLPKGATFWKVAIVLDTPAEKGLVSPYSRMRRIVHK